MAITIPSASGGAGVITNQARPARPITAGNVERVALRSLGALQAPDFVPPNSDLPDAISAFGTDLEKVQASLIDRDEATDRLRIKRQLKSALLATSAAEMQNGDPLEPNWIQEKQEKLNAVWTAAIQSHKGGAESRLKLAEQTQPKLLESYKQFATAKVTAHMAIQKQEFDESLRDVQTRIQSGQTTFNEGALEHMMNIAETEPRPDVRDARIRDDMSALVKSTADKTLDDIELMPEDDPQRIENLRSLENWVIENGELVHVDVGQVVFNRIRKLRFPDRDAVDLNFLGNSGGDIALARMSRTAHRFAGGVGPDWSVQQDRDFRTALNRATQPERTRDDTGRVVERTPTVPQPIADAWRQRFPGQPLPHGARGDQEPTAIEQERGERRDQDRRRAIQTGRDPEDTSNEFSVNEIFRGTGVTIGHLAAQGTIGGPGPLIEKLIGRIPVLGSGSTVDSVKAAIDETMLNGIDAFRSALKERQTEAGDARIIDAMGDLTADKLFDNQQAYLNRLVALDRALDNRFDVTRRIVQDKNAPIEDVRRESKVQAIILELKKRLLPPRFETAALANQWIKNNNPPPGTIILLHTSPFSDEVVTKQTKAAESKAE